MTILFTVTMVVPLYNIYTVYMCTYNTQAVHNTRTHMFNRNRRIGHTYERAPKICNSHCQYQRCIPALLISSAPFQQKSGVHLTKIREGSFNVHVMRTINVLSPQAKSIVAMNSNRSNSMVVLNSNRK